MSKASESKSQQQQEPIVLKKPVFITISTLNPGPSHGHNIYGRVLSVKPILEKTTRDNTKISIYEALIGDSTGTIYLTIRNEQINLVKPDTNIILRNCKVEMFKNHMRLAVDKWGLIEENKTGQNLISKEAVKQGNNLSDTEYELVNVD